MLFQLADGDVEVGVGEGLVAEGEVPPFAVEGFEAVAQHGLAQNHAVSELGGGEGVVGAVGAGGGVAAAAGVALGAEPVEGAAHVDFLLGAHVEEGEVDGGAAGVATLLHDVFQLEEATFVHVGVEVALHERVVDVGGPADEVVDGALRAVSVVDLEAVALGHDVVADGAQAVGGLAGEQGGGLLVAVDAGADEVVGAVVADFQDGVGHGVGEVDEVARVVWFRRGVVFAAGRAEQRGGGEGEEGVFHDVGRILFAVFSESVMWVMIAKIHFLSDMAKYST